MYERKLYTVDSSMSCRVDKLWGISINRTKNGSEFEKGKFFHKSVVALEKRSHPSGSLRRSCFWSMRRTRLLLLFFRCAQFFPFINVSNRFRRCTPVEIDRQPPKSSRESLYEAGATIFVRSGQLLVIELHNWGKWIVHARALNIDSRSRLYLAW